MLLWLYTSLVEDIGLMRGLGRMFSLISGQKGRVVETYFVAAMVGLLYLFLLNSPLLWFYMEVVNWNLDVAIDQQGILIFCLFTFILTSSLCLVFPLILTSIGFIYHSLLEINDAYWLREQINQIGTKKIAYGFEKES